MSNSKDIYYVGNRPSDGTGRVFISGSTCTDEQVLFSTFILSPALALAITVELNRAYKAGLKVGLEEGFSQGVKHA